MGDGCQEHDAVGSENKKQGAVKFKRADKSEQAINEHFNLPRKALSGAHREA